MDGDLISVIDHGSFRTLREQQFFVAGSSKFRANVVRNEPLSRKELVFHFYWKLLAERFDGRVYFQIISFMLYDLYGFRNFRKILGIFFKVSYYSEYTVYGSFNNPLIVKCYFVHVSDCQGRTLAIALNRDNVLFNLPARMPGRLTAAMFGGASNFSAGIPRRLGRAVVYLI